MEIRYTSETLKEAIRALEAKQAEEGLLLKEQFIETYENLKPLTFVKNFFKEFSTSEEIKNNFLDTAIGLTSGFVTKKVIVGSSKNPLIKLLGLAVQFGITDVVVKNFDVIKDFALSFIKPKPDKSEE